MSWSIGAVDAAASIPGNSLLSHLKVSMHCSQQSHPPCYLGVRHTMDGGRKTVMLVSEGAFPSSNRISDEGGQSILQSSPSWSRSSNSERCIFDHSSSERHALWQDRPHRGPGPDEAFTIRHDNNRVSRLRSLTENVPLDQLLKGPFLPLEGSCTEGPLVRSMKVKGGLGCNMPNASGR